MQPHSESLDPGPGAAAEDHARTRDRSTNDGRASRPDAARSSPALSPTSPDPRKRNRRRIRRQDSTVSALDREVLLALGRCRILSFDQLRRSVFPHLSPQRVGQRLQALVADGWLDVWEDVSRIGGRPRYVLPTTRALVLAHNALQASSAGTPTECIAALLLRARTRRPLVLRPRVTPAFLAHQRECNDLLIAYARIPNARLLWSTTLDRPLPLHAAGIALPQPDYVLVLEQHGTPTLVFGEHDRGHESLAHFRRTKAERYAALAARPELVRTLFGFERFAVWVTVLDARAGAPLRRLETLVHIARDAAASDVMAFTLAGWAVASPAAAIWFCDGALPDTSHLGTAKAHPTLRSLPRTRCRLPIR
ncbi:MAG: replication-relaxation family protein [Acidobacteriota bacterium]